MSKDETRHRLTGGPHEGKLLDQVSDEYLQQLAKSNWLKIHENEIYNAAVDLCKKKGISLKENDSATNSFVDLRNELEFKYSKFFKSKLAKYHPDKYGDEKKKIAEAKFKAVRECQDELNGLIESIFSDHN